MTEEMAALSREVGETKVMVTQMHKLLFGNGQPGRCGVHAQRIARLEIWRAWLAGAVAVLSVLLATATTIAAALLRR